MKNEKSETGIDVIKQLKENAAIAAKGEVPYCRTPARRSFSSRSGRT